MKSMDLYLEEYQQSHQNLINKIIHKVCVPLIFFTILGIIESVKLSIIGVIIALMFYIITKTHKKLLSLIIIQLTIFELIIFKMDPDFRLKFCLIAFVIAWIFQFIGHKIEGKKPSFLKDLLFLLVGPIWVYVDLLKIK